MKGRLLCTLVLLVAASGCRFEVSYPDSYAAGDLSGGDGQVEDGVVEHDIPTTQCIVDSDCESALGQPYACRVWVCNDGFCDEAAAAELVSCDDGNACTFGDQCVAGVCNGLAICPDDGNECTKELCDSESGECYSQSVPGCGTKCKNEGEKLEADEACCQDGFPLTPVPVCSADWSSCGSEGVCSEWCCDQATFVCVNASDGECTTPWETPCNSSDCYTDQCSAAGGYCVQGAYSDPTGEQGPCIEGHVLSNLSCGDATFSCCVQKGCLAEGVSGDFWNICCDSTATPIPVDQSVPVPMTGAEDGGSPEAACVLSDSMVICTHCGDGTCDYGETTCNCPVDCSGCQTDIECGVGGYCEGTVCTYCEMQRCDSGLDDDCDGAYGEAPCQHADCGKDTSGYVSAALHLVLLDAQSYVGMQVKVVGWSKTGNLACLADGLGCSADLMLADNSPMGEMLEIVDPNGMGASVGCAGATSSTLACTPFGPGKTVMVWGLLSDTDADGALSLEYHGHCVQ